MRTSTTPRFSFALAGSCRTRGAIAQYRLALEKAPTLDKPHVGLGMALGSQGDFPAARKHFEEAAKSTDPTLRHEAPEALKKIHVLDRP